MAGEPGCSEKAFVTDLEACRQAAEAFGISLRSFVFPRNAIGHVDRLAGHGFQCYRGRPGEPFAGQSSAIRTALGLVDRVYPLGGAAVLPRMHPSGSWDIPQTFLFAPAESSSAARSGVGPAPAGPAASGRTASVAVPHVVPSVQRHGGSRSRIARAGDRLCRSGPATPFGPTRRLAHGWSCRTPGSINSSIEWSQCDRHARRVARVVTTRS